MITQETNPKYGKNIRSDALIISIVIKEYDSNNKYKVTNLNGIETDIENYENILVNKFGYSLISNISNEYMPKYGFRMTKEKMVSFLRDCRHKLFDFKTGTLYFDSLFVTIGAHGTSKGIICSEGKLFEYNDI